MRQAKVFAALLATVLVLAGPDLAEAHKGHREARAARKAGGDKQARAAREAGADKGGGTMAGRPPAAEGESAPLAVAHAGTGAGGKPAEAGAANQAAAPDDEADEEVEEVEEVAVEPEAKKSPGVFEILGNLHPMLVHMPIAWLFLLLLADVGGLILGRELPRRAGLPLLALTFLAMIPAVATGLMNAAHQSVEGDDLATLLLHRNLMFATAAVTAVALVLRAVKRELPGALRVVYLLLIFAAVALISAGGHIGGEMVYGEDYLPF